MLIYVPRSVSLQVKKPKKLTLCGPASVLMVETQKKMLPPPLHTRTSIAAPAALITGVKKRLPPPLHMRTSTAPPATATGVVKKKLPLPCQSPSSEPSSDRFGRLMQFVSKCLKET